MREVVLGRIVVLAVMLSAAPCWAGPSAWLGPRPSGNAYPDGEEARQYAMLVHDLQHRDAFQRVAGQTFRPEALVFDSDRDPLDVVMRRTEALLADIRRMPQRRTSNRPQQKWPGCAGKRRRRP